MNQQVKNIPEAITKLEKYRSYNEIKWYRKHTSKSNHGYNKKLKGFEPLLYHLDIEMGTIDPKFYLNTIETSVAMYQLFCVYYMYV